MRKEDRWEPILSACPDMPIRRRCGSRRSIQCAGVQQSSYYERSVVQVNKRVSFSAPVLKGRVRLAEEPPEPFEVGGVEGGDAGPELAPDAVQAIRVARGEDQLGPLSACSSGRFEPDAGAAADVCPRSSGSCWVGEALVAVLMIPPISGLKLLSP